MNTLYYARMYWDLTNNQMYSQDYAIERLATYALAPAQVIKVIDLALRMTNEWNAELNYRLANEE